MTQGFNEPMTGYVAFLRAINVAGHATVKMRAVHDAFAAAGCRNVSTYIQSGNILFESAARDLDGLRRRIAGTLGPLLRKKPDLILRTMEELAEEGTGGRGHEPELVDGHEDRGARTRVRLTSGSRTLLALAPMFRGLP